MKSLNEGWTFSSSSPDSGFLPVSQFPTNVHLDLLHHNLIPDPFVGKNELDVQWVGEKEWMYRTSFHTPKPLGQRKAVLTFHGLDTHATVYLNGLVILTTEDMFIPARVEVTELLNPCDDQNELVIRFHSAWFIGQDLMKQQPNHHWVCWNGDPSRLAVRKAQYHYVRSTNPIEATLLTPAGLGLGTETHDLWPLETSRAGTLHRKNLRSSLHDEM